MHINSIFLHFTLSLVNIEIQQHMDKPIPNRLLLKSFDKENNATGHLSSDSYWKRCSLWAATSLGCTYITVKLFPRVKQ